MADDSLVKLASDRTSLDDAELLDLEAVTGGIAGDFMSLGDDVALVRIFEPGEVDEQSLTSYDDASSAAAWSWSRLDLSSFDLSPEPALPLGPVPTTSFPVGGDQYVGALAPDYSETTFSRVTSGGVQEGVTLPGFPISLITLQ